MCQKITKILSFFFTLFTDFSGGFLQILHVLYNVKNCNFTVYFFTDFHVFFTTRSKSLKHVILQGKSVILQFVSGAPAARKFPFLLTLLIFTYCLNNRIILKNPQEYFLALYGF